MTLDFLGPFEDNTKYFHLESMVGFEKITDHLDKISKNTYVSSSALGYALARKQYEIGYKANDIAHKPMQIMKVTGSLKLDSIEDKCLKLNVLVKNYANMSKEKPQNTIPQLEDQDVSLHINFKQYLTPRQKEERHHQILAKDAENGMQHD